MSEKGPVNQRGDSAAAKATRSGLKKKLALLGVLLFTLGISVKVAGPFIIGEPNSKESSRSQSEENRKPSEREYQSGVDQVLATLGKAKTREEEDRILQDLKRLLFSLSPEEASLFLKNYLESGRNLRLRGEFTLGQKGGLIAYPSLRVALLDWSLAIDPKVSRNLSRTALSQPVIAAEWTIALRNLTVLLGKNGRKEILIKTEELLTDPDSLVQPGPAFYESLDFLVHYQAAEKTGLLNDFILTKERPDLKKSAFIALDALVRATPGAMFQVLGESEELRKAFPEMVAQQMARANLHDPVQAIQIKRYLQDTKTSQVEKDTFFASFPNTHRFLTPGLVSSPAIPAERSEKQIQSQRAMALRWLAGED